MRTTLDLHEIVIEIGGSSVRVRTADPAFLSLLENRYAGFVGQTEHAEYEFDVDLIPPGPVGAEENVRVLERSGRWSAERGDFRAEWNPASNRGRIRQFANPYSIDAVLRIVHTLVLSRQGGFLVHAASAVRNGRAFLFAGVSGAGKTTMARLAPEDAVLLTDEISYVRKQERRLLRLWHAVCRRAGQSGRKHVRAHCRAVPAGPRAPKPNRAGWAMPKPSAHCSPISCFLPRMRNWSSWCFESACEFVGPSAGLPPDLRARRQRLGDDRMTNKRYVARSSEIAARRLGDEMMIMSGRDSTLFTLERGGHRHLGGCRRLDAADEIVEQDLPGVRRRAGRPCDDAETLAEELADHGILLISDEPFRPRRRGQEPNEHPDAGDERQSARACGFRSACNST